MEPFPPGTQRIEDSKGDHVVLIPQPSADPNQPLNWSMARKAVHMTILSLYALVVFAILTVATPLWTDWIDQYGWSYDELNNGYASNMAALSVGCILFVPAALKIGRRPVYILTALVMFASAIWQAKMKTLGDMFGANVVAGLAGAVNETLFQVTVSDLFFVHQRGTMNGIYLVMVLVGNYLGPVAAGYVAVSQGWPWVYWWCAIFMGVISVAMILFLEETKYSCPTVIGHDVTSNEEPTLIPKTAKDQETPIEADQPTSETDMSGRQIPLNNFIPIKPWSKRLALYTPNEVDTPSNSFLLHVYQPFQILVTFPAVMFAALQYGFCIAMLAILAVTQASLYPLPPYNFSPVGVGNLNIPPAVGGVLGSVFGGFVVDRFILQVAKRREGIYEPETRLYLFVLPGIVMPIGTMMYGLTVAQGMPWAINCVGAGFIGFGLGGCGDIALTYLQDSYQHILGDALISVAFVRNIISTGLVFAITPWMTNMGVYNMFVLLGCLSVAVSLTCVPMIIWGRTWRVNLAEKYTFYSERQYQ